MKKQILFLIFAIFLSSCAPAQPPVTPTPVPTVTPIPSATPTPIPTVTSTPTEVPIPEYEFQVKDVDGNTILVVNDQLYKWEKSKLVPVEMENTAFENAIDVSNVAKALAPAEYFEGDQQALKDILFPPGVKVDGMLTQMAFKTLSGFNNGIGDYPIYGIPLSIAKVQAEPTDKFQLLVVNMVVFGVDQPVPIVVGKVENGQVSSIIYFYDEKQFGDYPFGVVGVKGKPVGNTVEFYRDLLNTPAMIGATRRFNSEKYSRDLMLKLYPAENVDFREYLFRRIESMWQRVLGDIGGWPTPPFDTNSGWINWDMNTAIGYDFDGYVIKSLSVFNK